MVELPIKIPMANHVGLMNVICKLKGGKPRDYKLTCDGQRLPKMHAGFGFMRMELQNFECSGGEEGESREMGD
jgi:hypothetical protein